MISVSTGWKRVVPAAAAAVAVVSIVFVHDQKARLTYVWVGVFVKRSSNLCFEKVFWCCAGYNTHLEPSELTDPSESLDPCLTSLLPGWFGITSQLLWTPLPAGFLRPPLSQSTHTQVNVMYRSDEKYRPRKITTEIKNTLARSLQLHGKNYPKKVTNWVEKSCGFWF